jgi:hypothetical protein
MKPIVYGGDWIDPAGIMDFPELVDIFAAVDIERGRKDPGIRKIMAIHFEPVGVRISNAYVISRKGKLDLILTLDPEVIAACWSKARFMPFGMTWIKPEDRGPRGHQPGVSFVCGGKDYMPGHLVRMDIWRRQKEVKSPGCFWRSSQSKPPGFEDAPQLPSNAEAKDHLFGWTHHMVVENCRQQNYFTEKLLDAIVTFTIPIYWGCPNIGDFFDVRGIVQVRNANEAIEVMNHLDDHRVPLDILAENYTRAAPYIRPMAERMQEEIMRGIFHAV